MKKLCKWLLPVLLFSLCLAVFATAGPLTLALEPVSDTVAAGETVTVIFSVTENPEIVKAQFAIHYDPAALQILSCTTDLNQFAADTITVDTSVSGTVLVDLAPLSEDGSQTHTATGQLLSMTFQTVDGYTGQTQLSTTTNMDVLTGMNPEAGALTVQEAICSVTVNAPSAHVHTEEVIAMIPATCTENGWTEGIRCSECGEILVTPQYIEPYGHNPGESVVENHVLPNCQEDGHYDLVVYCWRCAVELSRETVIDPTTGEHDYANELERVEPTCTTDGYTVKTCVCGDVLRTTLPATGHKEMVDPGYPATCTEPGLSDGSYCETCGQVFAVKEEIPATGHTEVVLPGYASTCVDYGLTDGMVCSQCDLITVAQTQLPLAEHNYTLQPGVAPTCTEPGWTEGSACAVCGLVETAREEIPATGHTEIYVSAVEPTCSAEGMESGTKCAVCDMTLSGRGKIAKLPHTEEILPGTEPTCSATGTTDGKYCVVCGEITVEQTEIPTAPHTPESIPAVEPSCSELGWTEGSRCSVCSQMLEEPQQVQRLPHDVQILAGYPATCTEPGLTEGQICGVCGTVIRSQMGITQLEHAYDHACDIDCNVCGAARASLVHSFSGWYVTSEATKNATGQRERTCIHCGYVETQTLPMLAGQQGLGLALVLGYSVMTACAVMILIMIRKKRQEPQPQEQEQE